MLKLYTIVLIFIFSLSTYSLNASETNIKESKMTATGSFEVKIEPQQDSEAPAGRMIIRKVYSGDIVGSGLGQMISKRIENGAAAYSAVEEFSGTVFGKEGAFTLIHNGFMSADTRNLEVYVLPGSGTGELSNISGNLDIIQEDGKHNYVFNCEL